MDGKTFGRFCAGVEGLSVGQIRALLAKLGGLQARIEARVRIDRRGEALRCCLPCGAEALVRWGGTATGLRRLRCKRCRRTVSSATGTPLARLWVPEKVFRAVEDMLGRAPSSCRALAARLGVDRMTVWRWRMRLLAALAGSGATAIGGVVDADEKLLRESRKGSREWVKHLASPAPVPAPDRLRWPDWRRRKDRRRDDPWVVAELETWMRREREGLSRHAAVAKAMDYMLKRWSRFTRFLTDGRICLTNNAAERALRGVTLGRTCPSRNSTSSCPGTGPGVRSPSQFD